jgi:hypothetical protein
MKRDTFDLSPDLSIGERLWRCAFLLALVGTLLMDLFVWRP